MSLSTLEVPGLLVVEHLPVVVTRAELCEAAGSVGITGANFALALERAHDIHEEQTRDNGGSFLEQHIYPVAHEVMWYGAEVGYDPAYRRILGIAALMHDGPEDSKGRYTRADCVNEFGPEVGGIVDSVTKRRKGEPFTETIARIRASEDPEGGSVIKGFDRESNLQSSLAMLPEKAAKAQRKAGEARLYLLPLLEQLPDNGLLADRLAIVIGAIDHELAAAA